MAIQEKKWWRKIFRPEPETKADVLKDISAIIEFLGDIGKNGKLLLPEMKKLEELEKESQVAKSGLLQTNLETQAKVLEKIIAIYESLQNDTDINGLRLKKIVQQFLARAQHAGLKELVEQKKQSTVWQCKW